MTTPTTSLTYRRAALQHASTVGLVIALFDTLLGNLGRAAAAMERKDIQTRCIELIHGFKVLQQLEMMVDMQKGGQAAINIRRCYIHVRGQMLLAQFKLAPAILQEQIRLLIDVRGAWQQVDARGTQPATPSHAYPAPSTDESNAMMCAQLIEPEIVRGSFSCSG